MLYVGFDPTFRDIYVYLLQPDGSLTSTLPPAGHHHKYTKIAEYAGGNGVNVFRSLFKLGCDVNVVIPADTSFITLLVNEGFPESSVISFSPKPCNTTVAIFLSDGERQLNSINMELKQKDWSVDVHMLWQSSDINISTNWGLNLSAAEWVACQILATCGLPFDKIGADPVEQVLTSSIALQKPLLIDAGLIYNHPSKSLLVQLLNKVAPDPMTTILGNEEEIPPLLDSLSSPNLLIEHHAEEVLVHSSTETSSVTVPPLPKRKEYNFVGAGDAFLAGYAFSLLHSTSPDKAVQSAIQTSQAHILSQL